MSSLTALALQQAIDPAAETLTVVPKGQTPVSMVAAPGVSLAGIKQGDFVSVHYTRHVTFAIGSANKPASATPTATVGQGARDPNAIATNGGVFVARVVKINGRIASMWLTTMVAAFIRSRQHSQRVKRSSRN